MAENTQEHGDGLGTVLGGLDAVRQRPGINGRGFPVDLHPTLKGEDLREGFADWFDNDPADAKQIITKASPAARARIAAQPARKPARRKSRVSAR